ncbi:hypothetical protein K8R03_04860 [Candidatus Kaiserbacteria bacterium]|nr:hypothetical protein [Candidatus Kaiserbacteria bacterium]
MAGTLFKSLAPQAEVATAGVYADHAGEMLSTVSGGSIEEMKEIGLDMSQNVVAQLTPEMVMDADKVILVGQVPRGPLPAYLENSPKLETWDVPDPGYGLISIRGARDMIVEHVHTLKSQFSERHDN